MKNRVIYLFAFASISYFSIAFSSDSLNVRRPTRVAPNFYLQDLEGQFHFLNDYCGTKKIKTFKKIKKHVVLLSFWATWCLPCREEYPIFRKLSKSFSPDSLKILLINSGEKLNIVKKYAQLNNIRMTILLDRYGVAVEKYSVNSLPHLFLIDQDQHIVFEKIGYSSDFPLFKVLYQKIDSLLKDFKSRGKE